MTDRLSTLDLDTIDAVAALFLVGWTRADMRAAFSWVDDEAVLDAWSRLTFEQQYSVLLEHYPHESYAGAIELQLFGWAQSREEASE